MRVQLASILLCLVTLVSLELLLRAWPYSKALGESSQFIFGEQLWYGRQQKPSSQKIAEFDPKLGWIGYRQSLLRNPTVIVLGDSWTYGLGVEVEQAFPSILQRLLPGSRVKNLGVSGFGIDQMMLLAERELKNTSDVRVIVAFIGSDLHRSCFPFYFGKRKPKWAGDTFPILDPNPILDPASMSALHRQPWNRFLDVLVAQGLRPRLVQLGISAFYQVSINRCVTHRNAAFLKRLRSRFGDQLTLAHIGLPLPIGIHEYFKAEGIKIVPVHDRLIQKSQHGLKLDSSWEHPGPLYHQAIAKELLTELATDSASLLSSTNPSSGSR